MAYCVWRRRSALWCASARATWRPDYNAAAHQLSVVIDCGVSDSADCVFDVDADAALDASRSPESEWLPFYSLLRLSHNTHKFNFIPTLLTVGLIATRHFVFNNAQLKTILVSPFLPHRRTLVETIAPTYAMIQKQQDYMAIKLQLITISKHTYFSDCSLPLI